MNLCPHSRLSMIEGHDQRGPFPRGQLVQWNTSSDGLLEDFSNETSLAAPLAVTVRSSQPRAAL
jgi:hypothetical protein